VRPRLLVVAVALLNLIAGASFGFVLGRASSGEPLPGHSIEVPHCDLATLADGLALPPEKDAKVRAILTSCGSRFDDAMKDVRPRLKAVHEQVVAELGAVLTKEQMAQLAEEYRRRYGATVPLPH
jgi:hypothetical protein